MNKTERLRLAERTEARRTHEHGGDFGAYQKRIGRTRRVARHAERKAALGK